MTQQQLKKEYDEMWKKSNPVKYVVWLICYIADLIPVVIILAQLGRGGMNDKKAGIILACIAVIIVLAVISMVFSLDRGRGWKKYLEENRHRLK